MTQDQVDAYIRTACTMIGGILMTSAGWTSEQVASLTTGVLGVSGLIFLGISLYGSWKAHSSAGIAKAAERSVSPIDKAKIAASLPNTTVVTTPEIAGTTPEANIVSNETHVVQGLA